MCRNRWSSATVKSGWSTLTRVRSVRVSLPDAEVVEGLAAVFGLLADPQP